LNGVIWKAVTNVGFRPTFYQGQRGADTPDGGHVASDQPVSPHVEAHLLDFEHDLYRQQVSLSFIARLRDEQRFSNVQDLINQVQLDIGRARRILKGEGDATIPGFIAACS
jgi:riboflavin kinase/FMN adenylyltransferase